MFRNLMKSKLLSVLIILFSEIIECARRQRNRQRSWKATDVDF